MPPENDDAVAAIDDAVVFFQGPLTEAKQMRDACVEADIPAILDRGACCGSSGCGCAPKLQVLVPRDDLPRAARLAADRWRASAIREGTLDEDHPLMVADKAAQVAAQTVDEEGAPACPACGDAAPLVAGACAGCGLQLE
ncbi:MAG: hypothetical protein ABUS79_01850 [Pseudomonadota bacterium]